MAMGVRGVYCFLQELLVDSWALMSFDGPVGSINRHEVFGSIKRREKRRGVYIEDNDTQ